MGTARKTITVTEQQDKWIQGDLPPGTSPLSKLDLGPFEVHSMV